MIYKNTLFNMQLAKKNTSLIVDWQHKEKRYVILLFAMNDYNLDVGYVIMR